MHQIILKIRTFPEAHALGPPPPSITRKIPNLEPPPFQNPGSAPEIGCQSSGCMCKGDMMNVHNAHGPALVVCFAVCRPKDVRYTIDLYSIKDTSTAEVSLVITRTF